jgi:hypothetical protein
MNVHGSALRAWAILTLLVSAPGLSEAQDEARLRLALEGERVTLQIDMPATSDGVDVFPGTSRPLDFEEYANRLKSTGTAYRQGEKTIITKVKVKGKNIEIHLGGGGFGTFDDELGDLFRNQGADSGAAQQAKIANERTQRLAAGSRFNLRYQNGVTPDDMTVEAVVQSLKKYATFASPPGGAVVGVTASPGDLRASTLDDLTRDNEPRKGMSVEDVERQWGKPASSTLNGPVATSRYSLATGEIEIDSFNGVVVDVRKRVATTSGSIRKGMSVEEVEAIAGKPQASSMDGQVTTNKYHWQEGVLEADFFNGVLVSYRIVSN